VLGVWPIDLFPKFMNFGLGSHGIIRQYASCYKIVFGLVDVSFDDFFTLAPLSHTRGQKHKLYKRHCSTNVGTSFFANRVVDTWNYLPDNIIDFNSLSAFKRTVKSIDFTIFLKCD